MKKLFLFFLFSLTSSIAQWQPVVPYPTLNDIIYIKAFTENEYIICTSTSGWGPRGFEIFTTANAGKTWKSIYKLSGSSLYKAFFYDKMHGWAISLSPYPKYWRTTDGGVHWNGYTLSGSPYTDIFFLNEKTGFAAAGENLLKSTDGGESWDIIYNDSTGGFLALSVLNENFIASAGGQNIKITTDGGINWSTYTDSTLEYGFDGIYFVDSINGYAMDNYLIWMKTTDGGKTWQRIVNWDNSAYSYADALFRNNTGVIAYGAYECCARLYITTDRGENWFEKSVDLHPKSISFINDSTFLIAGDESLMYKTTDYGTTFTVLGKERFIGFRGLALPEKDHFYIQGYDYSSMFISYTTNNGESFSRISCPYGYNSNMTVNRDSNIFISGSNPGKIFRSTNRGTDWDTTILAPSAPFTMQFSFPDNNTGYLSSNVGIFKTTDAGENWFFLSDLAQRGIYFLDSVTGYLARGNVLKTTDGGISWTDQGYANSEQIDFENYELGITGSDFIYYTYDGGNTWNQATIYGGSPNSIYSVQVFNHNGRIIGYASFGSYLSEMYYSTDSLKTWYKDDYFIADKIYYLRYNEGTLWAATKEGFILKRENFDDLLTSINETNSNTVPSDYYLAHNYPNPFNPTTKISYSIKDEGFVKLLIYDIKGELISTLVNEKQQAGSYVVDFALPGEISTGVYIYRLTVSDNSRTPVFADTKKMIFLK